jgi:RimJ/RimL family protein N-acetyltransferase
MIITQPEELIGAFVNVRQGNKPTTPWGRCSAMGLVRDGRLVAGLIYNGVDEENICLHIGAEDGSRWLTPQFLFAAFDYPFNQLGKRRITALLRSGNAKAIGFVENIGFELEGRLANYYANGDARLIYGMLREKCRFLNMKKAA